MTVRIKYKRTWYQSPPSFIDIEGCPSVEAAKIAFRQREPKFEILSAKAI